MRIAVTYDNGEVFQHFGRTESFKVYEVREGNILSSSIFSAEGSGHEALAGVLAAQDIDLVICGGMGAGMQEALKTAGIAVCSGASGNADEAVQAFLAGELTNAGINCDHHGHGEEGESIDGMDEEAEGCGCGCSGGCGGGSCGGGCGGCGEPQIIIEGPNAGKVLKVHYKGTLNDGTQFDSSYDRGEALEFICGIGQMIKGFDEAVVDMVPGEVKKIHLMPEEAYGEADPNAIFSIEIAELTGAEELVVGDHVYLTNMMGQPFPVTVTAKDDKMITFDANHELAGKELNFEIELVEIR